MLATYCLQSFQSLANLVRQHGPESLLRHATLLASLQVTCLVMLMLPGTRAFTREEGDDLEWLLTLPAPAWVLHTAKVCEAALLNPLGWLLLFPFFLALGIHCGVGLMAPLAALFFTLPILFCCALLGSAIDAAPHWLSHSRVFRVLRFVGPLLGSGVVLFWLTEPSLRMLHWNVWSWLESAPNFRWLPFSEPVRVLASWQASPARSLRWLTLFGAEMVALMGLGVFALRNSYGGDLVLDRDARRGRRGPAPVQPPPTSRRHLLNAWFGPVVAHELLWLRRNPSQGLRLILAVGALNTLALLLGSRVTDVDASLLPGWTLLGVGLLLLMAQVSLLERERPNLRQLASLPRPMSWVFGRKTVFAAATAALGASPAVAYTCSSSANVLDALPGLVIGAITLVSTAFLQTSLWLGSVSSDVPTAQSKHVSRMLQLWTFGAWLGTAGLRSPLALATLVPLVYGVGLSWMCWKASLSREMSVLDPSEPAPRVLTPAYALFTILLLQITLDAASAEGVRRGLPPAQVAVRSFVIAAVPVLFGSLLWLKVFRGVSELPRRLGLSGGQGLSAILREGVLWSVPAIAGHFGYAFLETHFVRTGLPAPTTVTILSASPAALVAIACAAAPLTEELLYRGMLYRALRSSHSIAVSALLSGGFFALAHPLASFIPVFIAGVCAALALERTRSLYTAILVHVLYNSVPVWIALHPAVP